MRNSELLSIKLADINWANQCIKVLGKDNAERLVPVTTECEVRLQEYLKVRATDNPHLILTYKGTPMKNRTLNQVFEGFSESLGFRVTPHILRHTFAANLAQLGVPNVTIQALLGHVSVNNTMIYTKLFDAARKKLYDQYI